MQSSDAPYKVLFQDQGIFAEAVRLIAPELADALDFDTAASLDKEHLSALARVRVQDKLRRVEFKTGALHNGRRRYALVLLEYQSHVQTFVYTPQHFIPAGLGTLLVVQLRRHARFLAVCGVVLALCAFWSSLLSFGLLALAVALPVGNRVRLFATWQNLLVAPALAAVLALYLTAGKVAFPSGWLWEVYSSGAQLAADMGLFYLFEVLAVAVLLLRVRPAIGRDPFFLVACVLLLAAPWWWYGREDFSEFTTRAVMPPLLLISYHAARALARRFQRASRVWH